MACALCLFSGCAVNDDATAENQVVIRGDDRKLTLEGAAGEIEIRIRKERLEEAYGPWLAGLKDRYQVEIYREAIS